MFFHWWIVELELYGGFSRWENHGVLCGMQDGCPPVEPSSRITRSCHRKSGSNNACM
jgi:hypothetical protein